MRVPARSCWCGFIPSLKKIQNMKRSAADAHTTGAIIRKKGKPSSSSNNELDTKSLPCKEETCGSQASMANVKAGNRMDPSKIYYALIACGSFNPLTNLHLRMFEVARNFIHRTIEDAVVLKGILSPVSDGYGKRGLEKAEHRRKMCKLGIKGNDWLELSTWESEQENWTPTINVLQHASDSLQSSSTTAKVRLLLLCGTDFLGSFNTPRLWSDEDVKRILQDFGLVVIQRPGYDPYKIIYENDILYEMQRHIHIVNDCITNDTSSTKLRLALRRRESIRYLAPDSVVDYIEENSLYTSEEGNIGVELAPYRKKAH